ncbi:MAG: SpoIID/LytB domain-containing protein [Candidatus Omnitrophota bacterium]|jgi:stage II sporulation protein D
MNKSRGVILQVIVFTCLLLPISFSFAHEVRVRIIEEASSLNLIINGVYKIQDADTQKVLSQGKNLNTTVTVGKNNILIGNTRSPARKVYIKPVDTDALAINGRKFKGSIEFLKKDNGCFAVINFVELEEYIKGVLFHESSHYWPQEALKAQSIVCRTFALSQVQENVKNDYDVTSDIYSQMYGGSTSERYRTNRAVEETEGQVITYQGKIFPAYYHATCAGHTENAAVLWNTHIPPLEGVACDFCKGSPHYRWHLVLSESTLREKLAQRGYTFKKIHTIACAGKDNSGRISEVAIRGGEKGVVLSGKDFRNALGPNLIKSLQFEVSSAGSDFVFEGLGWGHGVGFCQWGAYFMAKEGRSYQEILAYYYPGAVVSPRAHKNETR